MDDLHCDDETTGVGTVEAKSRRGTGEWLKPLIPEGAFADGLARAAIAAYLAEHDGKLGVGQTESIADYDAKYRAKGAL